MRYWHWPEVGYGSNSYESNYGILSADFGSTYYDWNHMPDTLSNACTEEEIDAVATLMYHAGVSVDMNYGPNGRGFVYIVSCRFLLRLGRQVGLRLRRERPEDLFPLQSHVIWSA